MKQGLFTIKENRSWAGGGIFRMVLEGDTLGIQPGQFVNLKLPERYLRRPISVCDAENDELTLIYKVVGAGTSDMTTMQRGTCLDVLTCLGNGYDLGLAGDAPVLLGGGVGTPPLYMLAKKLAKKNMIAGRSTKRITVILGFNTKREVFFEKEFKELGCNVLITTVDGSYGINGYVTTPLEQGETASAYGDKHSFYYTCGPTPMLKAVHRTMDIPGQLSLEERMGCGFGACMGCSMKVKGGYKRVCKDGPVFSSEELLWD